MSFPRTKSCWYRLDPAIGRVTLTLQVQPGARRTEIAGLHGGALKIRLAERALEGRANAALIAFIAGLFEVPLRQVSLLQGETSRHKVVAVQAENLSEARLLALLV